MAHTPGPWEVKQGDDERDFIVAEPSGNTVCEPNAACFDFAELDPNVRTITLAEAQANARLIAAAPELLACLRRMCGMYGAYSKRLAPLLAEDEGTMWAFENVNSLALEAIAKAEGQ